LVYKNRGPVTRSVDCQQNKKRRRGRLPMMFQLFVATRKGSKEAPWPTIGRLLTKQAEDGREGAGSQPIVCSGQKGFD